MSNLSFGVARIFELRRGKTLSLSIHQSKSSVLSFTSPCGKIIFVVNKNERQKRAKNLKLCNQNKKNCEIVNASVLNPNILLSLLQWRNNVK